MSLVDIIGLQVVRDDVAVGNVTAEVDVEGNGAMGSTAAVLAKHSEGTGVVGASGDGLACSRAKNVSSVEIEEA
jgi:hypothetical protein